MAEVYVWLALNPELSQVSGKHFNEKSRSVRAFKWAHNKDNFHQLMEITHKYIPELSNKLSV